MWVNDLRVSLDSDPSLYHTARVSPLQVAQYAPVSVSGLLHHAVNGQHARQR
jgi:hypothetical protein